MRLAPEPNVLRGFARAMGLPTSELMAVAGHGDAADPILDREEALRYVCRHVDKVGSAVATSEELETCRRVLDILLTRQHNTAPVDERQDE